MGEESDEGDDESDDGFVVDDDVSRANHDRDLNVTRVTWQLIVVHASSFLLQVDDGEEESAARKHAERRAARAARLQARVGGRKTAAAARATAVLGQLYGEHAMAAHYQTKADDMIRATDLPERIQLTLGGRPPPHPKELDMEATYILNRLFPDRALHGNMAAHPAHCLYWQLLV